MHALARDPSFRPASAAELALELAPGADDERPTLPLSPRRTVSVPGRGGALWLVGALVVAAIAVALGLAKLGDGGDSSSPPPPARVTPPAPAPTAEQQARNLARWLRVHSR
jgi:hypothetical protein